MIFFVALSSGIYLNNAHSPTDILRVHLRKVKQRTHDVCHVQKTAKGRLRYNSEKVDGMGTHRSAQYPSVECQCWAPAAPPGLLPPLVGLLGAVGGSKEQSP